MTPLGKADIHLHSTCSDGMYSVEQILDWVETRTDLQVIAITDHDTLDGSVQMRALAERRGSRIQVISGMEVSTRQGHLLALFIDTPVPSYRPLRETVDAVMAQGGICVAPHPFSWLITSIGERTLDRVLAHHDRGIVGIETMNPTPAGMVTHGKTKVLNSSRYQLAETGGSDAHFLQEIGSAYTTFPGTTADDLRAALAARTTAGVRSAVKPAPVPAGDLIRQQGRSLVWLPYQRMRRALAGA